MIEILAKEPFLITNENELLLLSRFLIEDNTEDKIQFNEDSENTVIVIKSVFKTVVGSYNVLTEEQEQSLREEMIAFAKRFHGGLEQSFRNFDNSKKGFLDKENIQTALKTLDPEVPEKYADYLIMKHYPETNDLNKINYKSILDWIMKE